MTDRNLPSFGYRADLDGIRALAVLAVVAGHARVPFLDGGFVGVDVFFVLSGYLITSIMAREIEIGKFSFVDFYERRARRILPALFFMLFSVSAAGYFLFPPWQYEQLAKTLAATAAFGSNLQLMSATGDYFSANADLQPLLHIWSLAVEEQFYFLFPPLLLLAYRFGRRCAIITVGVLCVMSFIWAVGLMPVDQKQAFFLPHLRAWELGLGALLALYGPRSLQSDRIATAMGAMGLLLIFTCIALYGKETPFPGLSALPVVVGTLLLIYSGRTPGSGVSRILSWAPSIWIGKISYSLYLWHWPPIVLVYSITAGNPGALLVGGAVVFSFLAAWLSWRFVETPFRIGKNHSLFSRAQVFRFSGIGIMGGLCAAVAIIASDGFSSRISENAQQVFEAARPISKIELECREAEPLRGDGCRLGDVDQSGEPEIVVWGDSHAGAWLPGIDVWLQGRGLVGTAFVKSACLPMVGHIRVDIEAGRRGCAEWNDSVLERLLRSEASTVILSGRWPLSFHGDRVGPEPGSPALIEYEQDGIILKGPDAMKASLIKTVRSLRAAGKNVLIIGSVPEIGWSVPERYLDIAFFEIDGEGQGPRGSEVADRIDPVDQLLTDVSGSLGAMFAPVFGHFCADMCQIEIDGHLLYRDDDHLSEMGAQMMIFRVLDGIAWGGSDE
jgi:peptidoglycan/LPS O-acetylase OafA/YrhL